MMVFNAAFNSCKPLFFLASTATTGMPKSSCNPAISILIPFFAARSFMVSANTTGIFKSMIWLQKSRFLFKLLASAINSITSVFTSWSTPINTL